jgi:hypothetical protein
LPALISDFPVLMAVATPIPLPAAATAGFRTSTPDPLRRAMLCPSADIPAAVKILAQTFQGWCDGGRFQKIRLKADFHLVKTTQAI